METRKVTTSVTLPMHESDEDRLSTKEVGIGARVRIRRRQRIGGDRYADREGVIIRTHFAGFYVRLDMTPRERTQKTELVETAFLEVLAPPHQIDDGHDQGDDGPFVPRITR